MKLKPPIYWKVKHSEKVRKEILKALNTNEMYFQSESIESVFKLIPFKDQIPAKKTDDLILWNRKQLEIFLKYQN
tara:strand:+ start:267 stop:491 length:225 start_codon:yes stop_codon:yes gene_type:complete